MTVDCMSPERRRSCAQWLQLKYKQPTPFVAEPLEKLDLKVNTPIRSNAATLAGAPLLVTAVCNDLSAS